MELRKCKICGEVKELNAKNIELNSKLTPDGFDIICNSGISWTRPDY